MSLYRFFKISQFKRSAIPNGPKVGSGGSLSPVATGALRATRKPSCGWKNYGRTCRDRMAVPDNVRLTARSDPDGPSHHIQRSF